MGIDIVPLAYKHKLDISTPEAFAKDISERFVADVFMEKEDKDYNSVEILRLHNEKAKHEILIRIPQRCDEDKILYDVCIDKGNDISFQVYPYHVDLYLTDSPFRWGGFEDSIWYKDEPTYLKTLTEYRNYIKNLCTILGCTKCIYIPDQGCTEHIWYEAQKGIDYDSLIEYIRKRKYLNECVDCKHRNKSLILNLPCFLSKPKDYEGYPDVYLDVVMDDFYDL